MDERIIEYFVSDDVGEMRADKLFASVIEDVSRARLQKAFDSGQVSFEGEVIDKRFKIRHSGWLRATLDEVSMDEVPQGKPIPLDVVYEDDSIVVINKSSGMVTHPGNGTGEDTLVHALLHHCKGLLSSVDARSARGCSSLRQRNEWFDCGSQKNRFSTSYFGKSLQ